MKKNRNDINTGFEDVDFEVLRKLLGFLKDQSWLMDQVTDVARQIEDMDHPDPEAVKAVANTIDFGKRESSLDFI